MAEETRLFFVRRGPAVKGPIPLSQVAALVRAGKVLPSDEVATETSGPWAPVHQVLGRTRETLPVVEIFTIKKSSLFAGWFAVFQCPKCGESLECGEKDMAKSDACPTCRQRYQLSPRAAVDVQRAKDEQAQKETSDLALRRQRREQLVNTNYDAAAKLTRAAGQGLHPFGGILKKLIVISAAICGLIALVAAAEKAFRWYSENTPEATFNRFVWERQQDLFARFPLRPIQGYERDLRKTDSLTRPYAGTIKFSTVWQLSGGPVVGGYVLEGDATCEVACARDGQSKQWNVSSATVHTSKWRVLRSDDNGLAQKVADGMNREGVPAESLNGWEGVLSALARSNETYWPRALTELSEYEASNLGRSHIAELRFEKLAHVEPSVIDELVKERETLVAAAHGKNVWTSDKKWPFVPSFGYGFLILDRIPVVSDALARSVSGFRGTVSLAGVTSLSDAAADQLASHIGCLRLPNLQSVSQKAMVKLASRSGDLEIGVVKLPDEVFEILARDESPESRLDPKKRKHVALLGLTDISEAGIAAVVNSNVRFSMPALVTNKSAALTRKLLADKESE